MKKLENIPAIKGTKVVFGPCRLSYTHLFKPYVPAGETKGKYMTNVLIPKQDNESIEAKKTIKFIQQAIEEAKKEGTISKWGGKEPKKLDLPLRDGDEKDDDVYEDTFYLNAKCATSPGILAPDKTPLLDEDEMYSGVYAAVSVTFYPYDVNGNRGVACGLNNVWKIMDGERLGGRSSAESDFADVDMEDDDDL